jgi:hypothetical protein
MLSCNPSLGYDVIGYVGSELHAGIPNPPLPVLGDFADTVDVLEREARQVPSSRRARSTTPPRMRCAI